MTKWIVMSRPVTGGLMVAPPECPAAGRLMMDVLLAKYASCSTPSCVAAPSWFIDDEVPRFEKLIDSKFRKYLQTTLSLSDADKGARGVAAPATSG